MEIEFPRVAGYFLSKSRDLPVIPAGMGNTHKSRDFANPVCVGPGRKPQRPVFSEQGS